MTKTLKKVIAGVSAIAIIAGAAVGGWAINEYVIKDNQFTITDQIDGGDGGMIVGESEGSGISLMISEVGSGIISGGDVVDVGESDALSSATITATIQPASGSNKNVTFSAAWKNPSSVWATGKNVADYVTLSPSGMSCTISAVKEFDEQVIVTCASVENPDITATCTVDFKERASGVNFKLTIGGQQYDITQGVGIPLPSTGTAALSVNKTVGTVESTFAATAVLKLNSTYASQLQSKYGSSWGTGFDNQVTIKNGSFNFDDVFYELIEPNSWGGTSGGYMELLYAEIIDWTNNYSGDVFTFDVTVTGGESDIHYTYDCPLLDVAVPVGDVTLDQTGIIL